MIPKIIHLSWLSGDPFPRDIAECLESWKFFLSDYEIWLWGKKPADCLGLNIVEKPFDLNSVIWCKQAFEAKKYAFAADYIRLFAVYTYGGIYLDSDVMMYKSFDDLLHLPYFLGEDAFHCFEPAIFGAEKGTPWVHDVLKRYDGLEFINKDGGLNMRGLPVVFHDRLCPKYSFEYSFLHDSYQYKPNTIRIFPSSYFNSRNFIQPIKTAGSYCSHHFVGSWLKKQKKLSSYFKQVIPHSILNLAYAMMYKCVYSKRMGDVLIPYK